jgi:hypothetical protein
MTETGFFDSLERQLGDGLERSVARRRSRRRIARRAGGFAVGAVAIIATMFFATDDDVADADVSVQTRGGLVYLRLVDTEFDADEIQAAASEAGIDVVVEQVPVGPSLVGRFVSYGSSGEGELGELKELDLDGPAFSGFVIPAGYEGTIYLSVGRPAEDSELYMASSNAVSDGEPLACSGALDATPSGAAAIAADRGLQARWFIWSSDGAWEVDDATVASGELDDHHVVVASADGPGMVSFRISPPGTPAPLLNLTAPAAC